MMDMKQKKQSTSAKILKGYLLIIFVGAALLMLPISVQGSYGEFLPHMFKSLFTATSATCVTGLILEETGTYWSMFGQIIILLLIQIGGLGFMVVIYLIALVFRRRLSLSERKSLVQAQGFFGVSGVVTLIRKIFLFALSFELAGAILLSIRLIPKYGVGEGIYRSIFLSVSAFCNAGFDPLGGGSLVSQQNDVLVLLTIIGLIICGGLGFVVWDDIFKTKFNFKKQKLHTRVVLITSFVLLLVPTVLFLLFEYNDAFKNLNGFGNKLLAAFFQSTTCRTAGFAAVDQASLSPASITLSTILMFIGGSSGSTAGGVKITTFAVLVLSVFSTTIRKPSIVVGKRQIDPAITKQASAVFIFYLFMSIGAALAILGIEKINLETGIIKFQDVFFEVISAVGTVGLSAASTATFTIYSQAILILLMYIGRLGALSIIAFFREKAETGADSIKYPTEKIIVG